MGHKHRDEEVEEREKWWKNEYAECIAIRRASAQIVLLWYDICMYVCVHARKCRYFFSLFLFYRHQHQITHILVFLYSCCCCDESDTGCHYNDRDKNSKFSLYVWSTRFYFFFCSSYKCPQKLLWILNGRIWYIYVCDTHCVYMSLVIFYSRYN